MSIAMRTWFAAVLLLERRRVWPALARSERGGPPRRREAAIIQGRNPRKQPFWLLRRRRSITTSIGFDRWWPTQATFAVERRVARGHARSLELEVSEGVDAVSSGPAADD